MDDTDDHEFECALRETEEEIGLNQEFIDVCLYVEVHVLTPYSFQNYRSY